MDHEEDVEVAADQGDVGGAGEPRSSSRMVRQEFWTIFRVM
ncbi:hypothetical protein ACFQVA_20650 [Actinomadura keratinilytica]